MNTRYAGLAAAILALSAPQAMAVQDVTKRATVAADATIEVSNVQGSVTITAWDRNEVELVARLESDRDELEFEATERHVRVAVERPKGKYRNDGDEAQLTLRVPGRARLDIETVSADIGVTGVRGEQRLESVSGEVRTQAFDAAVRTNSVSGDVTVTGNGGKAAVATENVSGKSTVTGVRGSYQGDAVSGEIHATVAAADQLEVNSVSGDIHVQAELAPSARVEMASVSGSVTLRIKPPVNADIEVESFSGDIENCFGQNARKTSKYTPGSELNFTQGRGGARVEIETLSGEISLCDR